MCFSAKASFITAGMLFISSFIGLSYAHTHGKRMLAITPLLFGIQQAIEGLLWISFGYGFPVLKTISTYGFIFFASIFWPAWIPLTIGMLEPQVQRARWIFQTWIIGICFSLAIIIHLSIYGATAFLISGHISYDFHNSDYLTLPATLVYWWATIIPFFMSSLPYLWLGGTGLLLAYAVSFYNYYYALGSLWCFFSALLSIFLTFYLILTYKHDYDSRPWH
jgi:hypothetical protein